MQWHSMSKAEVLQKMGVRESAGLSGREVAQRREQYGRNELHRGRKKGLVRRFLEQFSDFMVWILLIAAGISFFTALWEGGGDFVDAIIILVIVVVNAIIGLIQESRAEQAIEALQKLSAPEALVLREGREKRIPAAEVVVGDILLLRAGDYIPADGRLLESVDLQAEESSLTGESVASEKNAEDICREGAPLGDRHNMVFASGCVTQGHGRVIVVEVGMNTQVGRIASMLRDNETPSTPLQQRLAKTGKVLGIGTILICIAIFAMGLFQQTPPLEMFMIAVSLAVAAIPEGMPAVVTIVLALGVRKMAGQRAIIRKLPAVETLGSATVICSDKTGTLTQNRMTVTQLRGSEGILRTESLVAQELTVLSALCNNAEVVREGDGWVGKGEPTENALAVFAAQQGKLRGQLERSTPRVKEFPFNSQRKRMTTVHRLPDGRYRSIVKGAPDYLLPLCRQVETEQGVRPLSPSEVSRLRQQNEAMAAQALRVIAVGFRDSEQLPRSAEEAEGGLTFCGLLGMIDPPRPDVKAAVRKCKQAGIRPVMITGDHVITAKAIGKELGIFTEKDKAMTGAELDVLSQEELTRHIFEYSVFARVSPEHKVRIVRAFQSRNGVVAMTGDGVNDAPALKSADIGCAMGIGGTDVARGAADMILTDDNFSTIVEAVREGREIYANIRKAIHFLLSCNIGEILTVFVAFLMKLPTPLMAIQLLWVNLVTDSLPALALGVENGDEDLMLRRPIDRRKSLFADGLWVRILLEGCLIGSLALLAFVIGRSFFDRGAEPLVGRTMAFATLSISQLVHAFNMRSDRSLFRIGCFSNRQMNLSFGICLFLQVAVVAIPGLTALFDTVCLNFLQWGIVSLLCLVPLAAVELEKISLLPRKKG